MLDRAADTAGHDYWTAALDGGTATRADVATAIVLSDEAIALIVADDLYQSLLGRDPDADGATYWAGRVRAVGQRAATMEFLTVDEVVVAVGVLI